MNVGILTHYNVYNMGAQLQLYCMYKLIQDCGYKPYVLTYEKNFDFCPEEKSKNSASLRSLPYYFSNYFLKKGPASTLFNVKKVKKINKSLKQYDFLPFDSDKLDAVIIGSDEVFSLDVGCNRMMYGYGLKAPAVAYAPSFGRTTLDIIDEHQCRELISNGLASVEFLSARDEHTAKLIQELTGRDVQITLDPVLLYEPEISRIKPDIKENYILIYSYDRNMISEKESRAILNYAKKNRLATVSAGTYHSWCDYNIPCNAIEWYSYFQNAQCVITDTFHGTVCAVNNYRPFAVYIHDGFNSNKLNSLLSNLQLENQILPEISEKYLESKLSSAPDFRNTVDILNKMRNDSATYLSLALTEIEIKNGNHN